MNGFQKLVFSAVLGVAVYGAAKYGISDSFLCGWTAGIIALSIQEAVFQSNKKEEGK